MTTTMKLRRVGNSLGFIVPREVSVHMQAKEGDEVHVVTEAGGSVRILPYDPSFDKAMAVYSRTRRKYRNALRELAK
jgi:putative addiction module antidote